MNTVLTFVARVVLGIAIYIVAEVAWTYLRTFVRSFKNAWKTAA